ncbi:hypothetical protein TRVL_06706 [Trypanosoma vivax]|nr:hypothetical protein TRVL_06706 [Trypanosoma vivax]
MTETFVHFTAPYFIFIFLYNPQRFASAFIIVVRLAAIGGCGFEYFTHLFLHATSFKKTKKSICERSPQRNVVTGAASKRLESCPRRCGQFALTCHLHSSQGICYGDQN